MVLGGCDRESAVSDLSCRIVSYSDAADTDSVRPILSSARARSPGVTATEKNDEGVDDRVIAESKFLVLS